MEEEHDQRISFPSFYEAAKEDEQTNRSLLIESENNSLRNSNVFDPQNSQYIMMLNKRQISGGSSIFPPQNPGPETGYNLNLNQKNFTPKQLAQQLNPFSSQFSEDIFFTSEVNGAQFFERGSENQIIDLYKINNGSHLYNNNNNSGKFDFLEGMDKSMLMNVTDQQQQNYLLDGGANNQKFESPANFRNHNYLSPEEDSNMSPEKESSGCNCRKSKCLKLYCECFANQTFCTDGCNCMECRNREEFQSEREKAVLEARSRNPDAFLPKVEQRRYEDSNNKKGCHCKKTKCIKKYCECYNSGIKCTNFCKCDSCENGPKVIIQMSPEDYENINPSSSGFSIHNNNNSIFKSEQMQKNEYFQQQQQQQQPTQYASSSYYQSTLSDQNRLTMNPGRSENFSSQQYISQPQQQQQPITAQYPAFTNENMISNNPKFQLFNQNRNLMNENQNIFHQLSSHNK